MVSVRRETLVNLDADQSADIGKITVNVWYFYCLWTFLATVWFVFFLVRWFFLVLRVNLKPNDFLCSAVPMVFVVQINHINAAVSVDIKANLRMKPRRKMYVSILNRKKSRSLKEQGWKARLPFSGVIEMRKFREILSEKGKAAKKML